MLFSANQLVALYSLQDGNRYVSGFACIKAIVLDQITVHLHLVAEAGVEPAFVKAYETSERTVARSLHTPDWT